MNILNITPNSLCNIKSLYGLPYNKYRDTLIQKYAKRVSKANPSQREAARDIAKLAYKAGIQDAKTKYHIKEKEEYEDDDDDEFDDY